MCCLWETSKSQSLDILQSLLPVEGRLADQWCKLIKVSVEFTLQDCTNVGCLTESHSVEVNFGLKWASNRPKPYYSYMTSKRSGILFILCIPNDDWTMKRLESVNEHLDFPTEFSFLKTRGSMNRKTLIAYVLSLINA